MPAIQGHHHPSSPTRVRAHSHIYVANLAHSISSKAITGRGVATPLVERDRSSIICHSCERTGHNQQKFSLSRQGRAAAKPTLAVEWTVAATGGQHRQQGKSRRGKPKTRQPQSNGGRGYYTITRLTTATPTTVLRSTLTATLTAPPSTIYYDQGDLQCS